MRRAPESELPAPSPQPAPFRPDPCLYLELQESFYGRYVPLRWRQGGRDHFGEAEVIGLGCGTVALDPAFFPDVIELVVRWLAYWSGYRVEDVRRTFTVQVLPPPDGGIEARPVEGHRAAERILKALVDHGASLRPTLH